MSPRNTNEPVEIAGFRNGALLFSLKMGFHHFASLLTSCDNVNIELDRLFFSYESCGFEPTKPLPFAFCTRCDHHRNRCCK